ncbi:hypothetical protein L1887_25001 [Cichorium endivia]|nr:hypothetical protein L1887_25001 [Cichorium endivia]
MSKGEADVKITEKMETLTMVGNKPHERKKGFSLLGKLRFKRPKHKPFACVGFFSLPSQSGKTREGESRVG